MSLIKKLGVPLGFFCLGVAATSAYFERNKDLTRNIESAKTVVVEKIEVEQPVPIGSHVHTLTGVPQIEDANILVYGANLKNHDWKFLISAKEYFKLKKMSHRHNTVEEYVKFVTYDNEKIKEIAENVTKFSSSQEEKAQVILDFVHQIVYDKTIEDDGMPDYVRYPLETLVERNGDCEDLTILAASLMKAVGIDVAFIHLPPPPEKKSGHLALGVVGNFSGACYKVDGKNYFYTETTGTDWLNATSTWKIGQIPEAYKERKANILIIQ